MQLAAIKRLQAQGLSLAEVQRQLVGLTDALACAARPAPGRDEPQFVDGQGTGRSAVAAEAAFWKAPATIGIAPRAPESKGARERRNVGSPGDRGRLPAARDPAWRGERRGDVAVRVDPTRRCGGYRGDPQGCGTIAQAPGEARADRPARGKGNGRSMNHVLRLMSEDETRRGMPDGDEAGLGALRSERGLLPLKAMDVRGRIDGLLAQVSVRQTFVNVLDEPLEAT